MKKRIILRFKKDTIDKPIVYRLVKDYNLVFNILRANISPKAESLMVMELEGTESNFKKGIKYLKDLGIDMEPMERDINRDEDKCVHCGICTSVCAPEALYIKDRRSMNIEFDYKRCIACELCVRVSPVKAMSVSLE